MFRKRTVVTFRAPGLSHPRDEDDELNRLLLESLYAKGGKPAPKEERMPTRPRKTVRVRCHSGLREWVMLAEAVESKWAE